MIHLLLCRQPITSDSHLFCKCCSIETPQGVNEQQNKTPIFIQRVFWSCSQISVNWDSLSQKGLVIKLNREVWLGTTRFSIFGSSCLSPERRAGQAAPRVEAVAPVWDLSSTKKQTESSFEDVSITSWMTSPKSITSPSRNQQETNPKHAKNKKPTTKDQCINSNPLPEAPLGRRLARRCRAGCKDGSELTWQRLVEWLEEKTLGLLGKREESVFWIIKSNQVTLKKKLHQLTHASA